ncbi:RagB/SusD family protein [Chitinophaga horti]|uniref:RagB/SusD family protein n=1 Tax=Chitinophaga horti TaxID=2920382 RepID=A0ABY6J2Z6_9BACT|nr:RagB/SusD family protein [Chitinophaga horti]UYQ94040.1 RagB/SusD family protein [Chitinophaga horti]
MKQLKIKAILLATALSIGSVSCKKIFDVPPKDQLDISQMYRDVYDADAAIVGLYGKFQLLAEQYIVLNELRADMMNYTINANQHLRQMSTHSVTPGNPYASPRPFYELIINCNDVLKNFNIMRRDKKLDEAEYDQRYSDVGALRSFLYLQLGIHYGDIPYVTSALENVDAIKDQKNFPRVPFDALLDSLINFTEALPSKAEYPTGSTLNISVDGYPTNKWFINKKVLLGDLHLWKGNYVKSATWYREVMETATVGSPGGAYYQMYKLGWDSNNDNDHYISYSRAGDATSLVWNTGWRVTFEQAMNTEGFRREWIWALPFDNKFKPGNPFVKLFSPIGGDYLIKPSQAAIDMWANEQQRPATTTGAAGLPYDARGLLSWQNVGGQPVVMKYLYNYLSWQTQQPFNLLQRDSKWFLFRQTHLHLRFSEAANRAGKHRLAWGLMNQGIGHAYGAPSGVTDMTNYQNSLAEPYPFNFDARNSGSNGVPYFRADWYRNNGIRARANVVNTTVPAADSLMTIETDLIKETALEDGFEGTRWPDLLRVALRRNDPSFLADKIYAKLQKDGVADAGAVRAKLMNKANWYLPFDL